MAVILVQGTGDVGSAVAYTLFKAGHAVVLHDVTAPTHSRRRMAFVDALYEGRAQLLDLLAKRARTLRDLSRMVRCRQALPVVDEPLERVIAAVRPQVLVDARMRKRDRPASQRGLAPLTVGLGPNFEAGGNVDVAIETGWGDDLGTVLWQGRTRDLAGEPQPIDGHARDRYVYAPVSGRFETSLNVGDAVVRGQEVARIGETLIAAPLSGYLRGITHGGVDVREGTKVVEVDPRDNTDGLVGLGTRPRRIAEGVLKAIEASSVTAVVWHRSSHAFVAGALIGTLGGLIGLGGAEFRLPLLIGLFRFGALPAVILNKAMSLVVVAFALVFRSATISFDLMAAHWATIANVLAGSLLGAWFGADWATRLRSHTLYRILAVLLVLMAAALLFGHSHAVGAAAFSGWTQVTAGGIAGFFIGVVAALMGVAGGELLIPALILLFGVDVKLAGSLSLVISLPTMLVGFARYSRDGSFAVLRQHKSFVGVMAAGSLLGAAVGGLLLGIVPGAILLPLLSIVLVISATKMWQHK